MQWAKEHGCPHPGTCAYAALGGQLRVLQWAREHRVPWNAMTCAWAAEGGYLEVLRWAREHECPWNFYATCQHAARAGQLEVLQWVRENADGEAWDERLVRHYARAGRMQEVLRWLDESGEMVSELEI